MISQSLLTFPRCRLIALLLATTTLVGPCSTTAAPVVTARAASARLRVQSKFVSGFDCNKIRARASSTRTPLSSTTRMSLRGHGYSTKRIGGAPGKGGRRTGGGGHGNGGYRQGNRSTTSGGARRRPSVSTFARSSRRSDFFGEDRSGTEARRWGGDGWVDVGRSADYGGNGGGRDVKAIGKARGEFGKQYRVRRAGGTFAAKGALQKSSEFYRGRVHRTLRGTRRLLCVGRNEGDICML